MCVVCGCSTAARPLPLPPPEEGGRGGWRVKKAPSFAGRRGKAYLLFFVVFFAFFLFVALRFFFGIDVGEKN